MDALMDAIGYAVDALEKPGRAIRGVLAGKGRESLAAIPFSDSIGLTKSSDRTSGRDLTDLYGITNKYDKSFGSHALGFGADMLTDPLNLLAGAGAYKAAPTVAKGIKAGAKAVTGLDVLDTIRGGAKALKPIGRDLFHGELGAIGWPEDIYNAKQVAKANQETSELVKQGNFGLFDTNPVDGAPDSLLHHLPWSSDDSKIADHYRRLGAGVGPRYPGGVDKLADAVSTHELSDISSKILRHPQAEGIASEIPEGSKYLGSGVQAMALRAPDGHVIRIAPLLDQTYKPGGRVDIPELLQPFRSQVYHANDLRGDPNPWVVEHLPYVNTIKPEKAAYRDLETIDRAMRRAHGSEYAREVTSPAYDAHYDLGSAAEDVALKLRKEVQAGRPELDPWDFHEGNVAMAPNGKIVGHDGGMVNTSMGLPPIYRWSANANIHPDMLEELLRMGAPDAIREAMETGNVVGRHFSGVLVPGVDHDQIIANQALLSKFLDDHARYLDPHYAYSLPDVTGFSSAKVPTMNSAHAGVR